MSATVTGIDIEYAFARLGTAIDAACTLAPGETPEMAQLRREAESLLLLARIQGWAAAEEILSRMHTRRVQAQVAERARREKRSAVSTLIDEEIEFCLAIVRRSLELRLNAAASAGLIDDEAGD